MIARFAFVRGSSTSYRVCRAELLEHRRMFSGAPIDIEGVQNVSLDQPRISALLRRTATGAPLADPGSGTFNIQAFYDTGASGVLLAKETADALGVVRATQAGHNVIYSDVGVGGTSDFEVSEPLYVSLGTFPSDDVDDPSTYNQVYPQTFGPLRTQIATEDADENIGALDVFGMPVMAGKVMVMHTRPVDEFDYIHTYLYNPGTAYSAANIDTDPGIAPTNLHVKLSYASFDRFTEVTPAGAPGPTLRSNPFIGPNPVLQLDANPPADHTPGITVQEGSLTSTGSWLLDTGASTSIISQKRAHELGVDYVPGTYGGDDAELILPPGARQFQLTIGGIGGAITQAGFFLDSITVPTEEGTPLRYLNVPVLVGDVTVADPVTGQSLTLDGVFGMNNLVASGFITNGSIFPDDLSGGPFDFVNFDEPNGVLGLQMPGVPYDTIAPTAAVTSAPNVAAAGASSYTFTVRYTDATAIRASTIGNGDVRVTSPGGFSQLATLVSVDNDASGTPRTGTYRITPPGGTWDTADNGTYTLNMVASAVSDPGYNFVAAGALGTFTVNAGTAGPSSIAARQVFYNNSKFDLSNAAANANDDAAIATDKSALRPGNTATFANYTSYTKGINGVMVDIAALSGRTPTVTDFDVRTGVDTTSNLSTWTPVVAPSVTIRPGAGINGSDRVTLIWPDGTIMNKWLRIAVKATANTGLTAQDVFYFGNAVGETGNSAGNAIVDSSDYYKTRDFLRPPSNPAPVTWAVDFNRDGITDITDIMLVRANATTAATALKLISVPSPITAPGTKSVTTTTAAAPLTRSTLRARRGWAVRS